MSRARRRTRITELLREAPVPSQEALRERLAEEGLEVTQATLSRDLSDLGVVKTTGGYRMPEAGGVMVATAPESGEVVLRRMVRQEMLGTAIAHGIVVVRTRPGWADALAIEIDRQRLDGVVGTIAGDDTIFLAVASPADAKRVADRLDALADGT